MTLTELVKELSAPIGKAKVLSLSETLTKGNFPLKDLMALTLNPDKNIAFRAAWILEVTLLQQPDKHIDELEYMLLLLPQITNGSAQRHYAKILMTITQSSVPTAVKARIQHLDMELVIEQLFNWLIDPNVKIAVKSSAAGALFNLKERYPWIKDELPQQLQFLMRYGTPAIQSKGKNLLRKLNK